MEQSWLDRIDTVDAVVLDLDGTLVDSVYQHVAAWRAAFLEVGMDLPAWRLHGAIGMGGDRLVEHVAGHAAEEAVGDDVRALHDKHFEELLPQVTGLPGAEELLEALQRRGWPLLLASSSPEDVTDRLLELVENRELLHARVTGSDVRTSKPAPDLLDAALDRVGRRHGLVVGDTVWDVAAAQARELPCVGLRTGGISGEALLEAGAVTVLDDPAALAAALESPSSAIAH